MQCGVSSAVALSTAILFSSTTTVLAQASSDGIGGPSSVEQTLLANDRETFAERLDFGFDYSVLGQSADANGTTNAVGGAVRFFGSINLYGGEGTSSGSLTFKVENRHRLGTDLAPQDLGFAVGYVGLPAITFSDAGWLLTNLFWQHTSADNRWAVVAGITDVTDYVDVYALGNPWAEFSNLVFSTNPTIPSPNQGFGLDGRYRFGSNGYVLAGIADANGDPSDPFHSLSEFFADAEVFAHAEFGWVGDWEDRYANNVHLTIWHSDARPEAGISSGRGAALSASWRIADRYIPFARIGASDGGGPLLDRSASFGLGIDTGQSDDRLAIGLNWGRPNENVYGSTNKNQLTAETYWRFSVADWLEITPDVQYIRNPALALAQKDIWIFGLRLRATF